jgi:hypothetical protein
MASQARRGRPSLTTGGRGALGWRGCVAGRSSVLGTRDGCALLEVIVLGSLAVVCGASLGSGALAGCPAQPASVVTPTTASTAMR